MNNRPTVGLVIVDTESYVLANNAIQHCVNAYSFASVTVFTDQTSYWPQYKTVEIPKIATIEEYNRIMLGMVPQTAETDFVLVIQFDGFILNGTAFVPNFFDFDYIGAVWPDYPFMRVGNGGFSWRSRKLLDAVMELAPLRPPGQAEDLFICRTLRPLLEARYGCVFADEGTARLFSYEIVPEVRPAFGFHGLFNLPLVYRDNLAYLVQHLPMRILQTRMAYLQYGVQQLTPEHQRAFAQLIGTQA